MIVDRYARGLKVAHPSVVANPTNGFDLNFRVFGNGHRTNGKGYANRFSSWQALVNPRSPQMLAAADLTVTEKAGLCSQIR